MRGPGRARQGRIDPCHAEDAARKYTVAGAYLQNGKDRGMVEIQRRRQLGGVIFLNFFK